MLQCSNIAVAELFGQRIITIRVITCRFFVMQEQASLASLTQGRRLQLQWVFVRMVRPCKGVAPWFVSDHSVFNFSELP